MVRKPWAQWANLLSTLAWGNELDGNWRFNRQHIWRVNRQHMAVFNIEDAGARSGSGHGGFDACDLVVQFISLHQVLKYGRMVALGG